MIQDGRKNVPGIQTGISERSANIVKTVTPTRTLMKKITKRKTTGVPTDTIAGGVVTTIDDLQTIAKDSTGLVQTETIVSIRTNAIMTKVQRKTVAKSHDKNTVNNPGITGDSGITGTNKQYRWKLIHPRKWREASPAYTVSCVNNSVITQRNAHVEKERRQS